MHRQLIEALRAEARQWDAGMTPAYTGDLQDILNGVAARLESGGDCTGIGAEPPVTGHSCETTAPSFYTVSGTLNGQKVSASVDCATGEVEIVGAEPDAESVSDDEPLTAEWLEAATEVAIDVGGGIWLTFHRDPLYVALEILAWNRIKPLPHITTRGEYRTLRKMLGIPIEGVEK